MPLFEIPSGEANYAERQGLASEKLNVLDKDTQTADAPPRSCRKKKQ